MPEENPCGQTAESGFYDIMRRPFYLLVTLTLAVLAEGLRAQTALQPPPKNVAVIVDVSRSLINEAREGRLDQARKLIADIVSGRGFTGDSLGWQVNADPRMGPIFKTYFQPGNLQPLTGQGRIFLFQKAGKFQTVRSGRQEFGLASAGDFDRMLEDLWPGEQDVKDNSTCYWYAMARVADRLKRISPDGYYLFVVSDEEDDPDYSDSPTKRGSKGDYQSFAREWRPQGYSQTSIEDEISRYFVRGANATGGYPVFQPRQDFAQSAIATFHQDGASLSDASRVQIRWYGMGVTPQSMAAPPAPPPPPPPLKAPQTNPVLEPLAGLSSQVTRTYDYRQPLIVCQVAGMSAEQASALKLEVQYRKDGDTEWRNGGMESPRYSQRGQSLGAAPATMTLKLKDDTASGKQGLEPGVEYEVRVREADKENGLQTTFAVKVKPAQNLLLTILAISSATAALGIFLYAWRTLRNPV